MYSQYADMIAKQNITTIGTVDITIENPVTMRAGNSITLSPGFSVESVADFSASIENIYDCGTSGKIMIENMPKDDEETTYLAINNTNEFSYNVYPNPSNELIHITYSLDTEITVAIELVNFLGQKLKTVLSEQNHPTGTHSIQIPISDLSAGIYFLTISTTHQKQVEKIIITSSN